MAMTSNTGQDGFSGDGSISNLTQFGPTSGRWNANFGDNLSGQLMDYNDLVSLGSELPLYYLNDSLRFTDDILREIHANFFMHKETATAVLIALYTISFCLGLFGNSLVIYIFARNRHMRTVTNSFLVNLACCDILVVCLCMPFSVAMEIYDNWIYGDAMCKIVTFAQGVSVSSSILTLAVISAERFYAIRRPLRARAFISRTRIHRIIASLWVIAALAALPSVFVRKEQLVYTIYTVTMSRCVEEWNIKSLKHVYNFVLLTLLYVTPVLFICLGYMQIGLNLWKTDTMLHAGTSASESANARANLAGRRKVAKMLFVMALLFAISWLPIHVLGILIDFLPKDLLVNHGTSLRRLHSCSLWLGHTNSSINPLCYCIMSTSFKAAIKIEFRRCCCGRLETARESFKSMSLSLSMTAPNDRHAHNSRRASSARLGYLPVNKSTKRAVEGSNCNSPDLLQHVPIIESPV